MSNRYVIIVQVARGEDEEMGGDGAHEVQTNTPSRPDLEKPSLLSL